MNYEKAAGLPAAFSFSWQIEPNKPFLAYVDSMTSRGGLWVVSPNFAVVAESKER
jgi:hypothetical protein